MNLFQSLCIQTIKDFEWIIVDDGSEDNIAQVVEKFKEHDAGFEIRYFEQVHGGKHRAINYAIDKAKGEFFFIVDSDDRIVGNAIELILSWIQQIRNRSDIAGVAGLCISQDGIVWGGTPRTHKNGFIECTNFERKKYNLLGDKAEIYKTDILKQFPFPEFDGEYFITENVCWDAIAAAGYCLRWYNVPIYICEYLDDGLTKNGANDISGYIKNYRGYCFYIKQSMSIVPFKERMYRLYWYDKTRRIEKISLSSAAEDINFSRQKYCLNLFLMPVAYLMRKWDFLMEKWDIRNGNGNS